MYRFLSFCICVVEDSVFESPSKAGFEGFEYFVQVSSLCKITVSGIKLHAMEGIL